MLHDPAHPKKAPADELGELLKVNFKPLLYILSLVIFPNNVKAVQAMPICIECCYPVPQLYRVLSSSKHKPGNPPGTTTTTTTTVLNDKSPLASPSLGADSLTANGIRKEALRAALQGGTQPKNNGMIGTGAGIGSGGDVRLTQCPRCKRFADKYVEHDFVVLFIDLVLVKPQVGYIILVLGLHLGLEEEKNDEEML